MVEILLSTFQSEMYLEEQIDSLINQTYTDWKLLIRDDGSTDNTVEIIKRYNKNYPDKIKILVGVNENLGVINSFELLLRNSTANYIMFCDHDDVWFPEKIEWSLKKMIQIEIENPELPILIHTDLTLVNYNNTQIIHNSFWKSSKLNPKLLSKFNYLGVCNGITGCTILINRYAIEICLPFSKYVQMHDSWISLCISKYGLISYINKPTIFYRQHKTNQIGAQKIDDISQYLKDKIRDVKNVIKRNKSQIQLLHEIEYGNLLKYVYFKISYFIRARI
ncbi:MAG TPA: glycosyltransferase family 2 protein [Candidatus Paceibacterota bacterium]